MNDFCHLHNHSVYSLLDGFIRIEQFANICQQYNMPAIAITDHGNMHGILKFYTELKKAGIKPVIGMEAYICAGDMHNKVKENGVLHHQLIFAKNNEGLRNLYKLSTISYTDGFYRKPRIDVPTLLAHKRGLIVTSSCLAGLIPRAINRGRIEDAEYLVNLFAEQFEDDFYLEVQFNGIEEQNRVNDVMLQFHEKYRIEMIATADAHYPTQRDWEVHDLLLAMQTKTNIHDEKRFRFDGRTYYLKSPSEIKREAAKFPGAFENTMELARKCNVEIETGKFIFPHVEGYSDEKLEKRIIKGLKERVGHLPKEEKKVYFERFKEELETICNMGFGPYFAVVADYCAYARKNGILMSPGRGSAAGSLISYALRITDVDPIKYGLSFSRFLNKERVSPPDIDCDFQDNRREEVIEYCRQKYGEDKVAHISKFGTMKARAVIRSVGRSLGYSYDMVDKFAKLVPPPRRGRAETIKTLEENKEFMQAVRSNDDYQRIFNFAKQIDGIVGDVGVNASGVVISDKPLVEYLPLYYPPKADVLTTQFEKDDVESIGLIKFDILGLKTLTVIDYALQYIEQRHGKVLPHQLCEYDLDDQEVYDFICSSRSLSGLFQLEGSDGFIRLVREIQPRSILDLAAIVALWRPGPIDAGMVDGYIEARKSGKKNTYIHPGLAGVLDETHGMMIYQEQAMAIARILAGYTDHEADSLRKAMAKKKPAEMEKHHEKFVNGCVNNGIDRDTAEQMFDSMSKQADYLFNKSHSVSYAMVGYWTAWLKHYYPVEFMTAQLNVFIENEDNLRDYMKECRRLGIELLPIDFRYSWFDFVIEGDKQIRIGYGAVKGVGRHVDDYKKLLIDKSVDFNDFNAMYDQVIFNTNMMNKKYFEALVHAGAFDYLGYHRSQLIDTYLYFDKNCRAKRSYKRFPYIRQMMREAGVLPIEFTNVLSKEELAALTKEYYPYFSYGDKLKGFLFVYDGFIDYVSHFMRDDVKYGTVGGIIAGIKYIKTKKGQKMCFVTIEDGHCDLMDITFFPRLYEQYSDLLEIGRGIYVEGRKNVYNDRMSMVASRAGKLSDVVRSIIKGAKKQ